MSNLNKHKQFQKERAFSFKEGMYCSLIPNLLDFLFRDI